MKHFIIALAALLVVAPGCAGGPAAGANKTDAKATGPKTIYSTDFESGAGAWKPKGPVKLEISTDVAHSGKNSLKVFDRSQTWHAPEMDITGLIAKNGTYAIACWFLVPKDSAVSAVKLTVETSAAGAKNWTQIAMPVASDPGKWVQVVGKYVKASALDKASVYVEPIDVEGTFYVDDISITEVPA